MQNQTFVNLMAPPVFGKFGSPFETEGTADVTCW